MPLANFFKLRREASLRWRLGAGALSVAVILLVWALLTRGASPEERIISPVILPSPGETFASFHELWFDRELSRNLLASLLRVGAGFALAALIGVPLGVVCGAWPRIHSFFMPVSIFGRNVPISALVPLTLLWFGTDELQKIMFIFVACLMFVVYDTASAVAAVHERYVQTALTLGATSAQAFFKVLVPLALPSIFSSLRLLFGLAFGYIILAEQINTEHGAGHLISISQRIGPHEHIYLILIAITLCAYLLDRVFFALQRILFPYEET